MKKNMLFFTLISLFCPVFGHKTTIINGVPRSVDIAFQALGCGEMNRHRRAMICKEYQYVTPGHAVSYSWKWGQNVKGIYAYDKGEHGPHRPLKGDQVFIWKGPQERQIAAVYFGLPKYKKVGSIRGFQLYSPDSVKKTIVTNNAKTPIKIFFTGFGCAIPHAGFEKGICLSRTLQPGASASYNWRWGQADKEIIIKTNGHIFQSKDPIAKEYNWQGYEEKQEFDSQKRDYITAGIPKNNNFYASIKK